MPPPAASLATARHLFRRFRRSRRGTAAVEFALVAPLFFALLFAVIETAIVFFASQVLETVIQDAARQVLTGKAQTAGYTDATKFRNGVICQTSNVVNVLFDCQNGIYVDVQSYPSFTNVPAITNPIDGSGNFTPGVLGYNPGGSCDTVVARIFYQWPLFVTGLGYNISNLTGNKRLLVATAAFRNEPYNGACP